MLNKVKRTQRGGSIAELAAAMVLLMPLIVITAFVVVEATEAYMINSALHQAALIAARKIAMAYGQNPTATKTNPSPYLNITIGSMVKSPNQFAVDWSKEFANPPQVNVICTYTSGVNGCPRFPSPDPLNLGSAFQLQSRASARLE